METPQTKPTYVLCATLNESPIRDEAGHAVEPTTLPLSDRLLLALDDWSEFFDESNGHLDTDDESTVVEEFVGQAFKLAHRLRSELKGRQIYLVHPATGERRKIERQ